MNRRNVEVLNCQTMLGLTPDVQRLHRIHKMLLEMPDPDPADVAADPEIQALVAHKALYDAGA